MSTIQVTCRLNYELLAPTHFMFMFQVAHNAYQTVLNENLILNPYYPYEAYMVNQPPNRGIRLSAPAGLLSIDYQATVQLSHTTQVPESIGETPYAQLPPSVLPYLNPSRYCESDRLGRFAIKKFGQLPKGFTRVQAICDWVQSHLDYVPGSTNVSSSVCEVLVHPAGVCRDFAHMGIALCRALGIPARYIAAYAPGLEFPADFHGVFEAYLDGRWYLFDATRMAPLGSLVRISTGRDAADTSFATLLGTVRLQQMYVNAVNTTPQYTPLGNVALSTAHE